MRAQPVLSCVTVASDLCTHLAQFSAYTSDSAVKLAPRLRTLARSTLDALLPFLVSPVGICRALAQVALYDAAATLYPSLARFYPDAAGKVDRGMPPRSLQALELFGHGDRAEGGADPDPGAVALVPYVRMVVCHPDSVDMVERQRRNLARLDPARTLTLDALLCSAATEHGELVPPDVLAEMKETLTLQSIKLHEGERIGAPESCWLDGDVSWAIGAGILPKRAAFDERLRHGMHIDAPKCSRAGVDADSAGHTRDDAPPTEHNFQRKVHSAAATSEQQVQSLAGSTPEPRAVYPVSSTPSALPPLRTILDGHASADTAACMRGISPVLTQLSDAGRPCQPLVVVASLLDRAPNLGGLARTCEIFAGEGLIWEVEYFSASDICVHCCS
jgi:hypothetical protein